MNVLNRRSVVLSLLSYGLGNTAMAKETLRIFQNYSPSLNDPEHPSFDVFYHLSQLICCRENLDKDGAQTMYLLMQQEPWGKKHISTAYTEIKNGLENRQSDASIADLVEAKEIGDGEAWFVSHILSTWYTGIYFHEAQPKQRILYDAALMWDVVGNYIAPPGTRILEPGSWANIPDEYLKKLKK
ncbi:hypothetical protein F9L33_12905 [Amylibacter sp. SFDW26]|uniref:sugar dehydrogenase complex small subunit n=1 Tax=Amylibacter sp. SFDW26 TaxID=2652722 RepID=UPI001261F653|nr:sugar dehydrogenase complex small subunit [Amylibacter sp. SFDW26]KAB7613486.1 hypothetical protein F9L33_12905 [Amylibacter sp. SFDW26]